MDNPTNPAKEWQTIHDEIHKKELPSLTEAEELRVAFFCASMVESTHVLRGMVDVICQRCREYKARDVAHREKADRFTMDLDD